MFLVAWRFLAIVVSAATFVAIPLLAQNGEPKPAEAGKAETAKDAAGRLDEVAEASRVMTGPAARGECVQRPRPFLLDQSRPSARCGNSTGGDCGKIRNQITARELF